MLDSKSRDVGSIPTVRVDHVFAMVNVSNHNFCGCLFILQKKRGRGMQLKKCRYSTCNQLIPFDQKNPFCKKHGKNWHQRKFNYQKTNYKNYNKYQRDPVANAFYHSAPWRRLSVDLRRKSMWTCECCGHTYDAKSFLVVDHIIPFKVEPRLKLDRKNLWVLCKKCHFWKTKLEQQIYGASLIANLDTSKAWPRKKIQNWILTREKSK